MESNNIIGSLNILLVDDEAFVRRVNGHVLKSLTHNAVVEADSAREAIKVLAEQPIDLVITDIQMPVMNGLELMKQIRCGRTPARGDLPILVITSFSNTEVLGSSIALDVNGFLVKPISPKTALEKIRTAMGERIKLRAEAAYERVMTDLASLQSESPPLEQRRVNASVTLGDSGHQGGKEKGVAISLEHLKPGMTLLSELHTKDGLRLLSEGQVLNENLLNRMMELKDLVVEKELWVRVPPL